MLGKATHIEINGSDYLTSEDGTCVRDYVHVSDVAEVARLAVERLKVGKSGVYNVCGVPASVFEVLDMAERVTGQRIPRVIATRRPGDPGVLTGNLTRLSERFDDWILEHDSIASIVESAWEWFRTHPDGYQA